MVGDGIGEFAEFLNVKTTITFGAVVCFELFSEPLIFFFGKGVSSGCSEISKSFFNFFSGSFTVVIGINMVENSFNLIGWDIAVFIFMIAVTTLISSINKMAEIEVLEDSVEELIELFLIDFTWGLGVDLCSGFLDPFPLFSSDGVILLFSKVLNSDLDFIV